MIYIRAVVAGFGVLAALLAFSALDPQGAAGWLSLAAIYLGLAPAMAFLLAAPKFQLRQYLWNSGAILAASLAQGVVAALTADNEIAPVLDVAGAVVVVTAAELAGLMLWLGVAAAKRRDTASAAAAG